MEEISSEDEVSIMDWNKFRNNLNKRKRLHSPSTEAMMSVFTNHDLDKSIEDARASPPRDSTPSPVKKPASFDEYQRQQNRRSRKRKAARMGSPSQALPSKDLRSGEKGPEITSTLPPLQKGMIWALDPETKTPKQVAERKTPEADKSRKGVEPQKSSSGRSAHATVYKQQQARPVHHQRSEVSSISPSDRSPRSSRSRSRSRRDTPPSRRRAVASHQYDRRRGSSSPDPEPTLIAIDFDKIQEMKRALRRKQSDFLDTTARSEVPGHPADAAIENPTSYKLVMKKLSSCLLDLYPSRDSWYSPEARPQVRELSKSWTLDPEREELVKLPISDTAISMIDRLNYDLKHLSLEGRNKTSVSFLNQKGGKMVYSSAPEQYVIQQNYSLDMERQPPIFKEELKRDAGRSIFEPRCGQIWFEMVIQEVSSITKHANYLDLALEAITRLQSLLLEDLPQNISATASEYMNSITNFLGFSHSWASNILKNSLTLQANLEIRRRQAEMKNLRVRYACFEDDLVRARLFLPVQYQETLQTLAPEKVAIDKKLAEEERAANVQKSVLTAAFNAHQPKQQGQGPKKNRPQQGGSGGGQQKQLGNAPRGDKTQSRQATPPRSSRGRGRGGGGAKPRGGGGRPRSPFRDPRPQNPKPKRGGRGSRGSRGGGSWR